MQMIWDKWKNKILITKPQGEYNLFVYEKGNLKKIINSYTENNIVNIKGDGGNIYKYYAYMKFDLDFISNSFNDLYELLSKEYEITNDEDFDISFKNYLYETDTKLYVNFINKLDVFNFLIDDDIKLSDKPDININVREGKIIIKNNENKVLIEVSAENLTNDDDLILAYNNFTKKEIKNIKKSYESLQKAQFIIIKNY